MASQAEEPYSIGRPIHIPKALRLEMEVAIQAHLTAVEKLIVVLDKASGDADFEQDAGDEPENTWSETHGEGGARDGYSVDDVEPSLAHTNDVNQEAAQQNLNAGWDAVYSGEDREPDADDELKNCPAVMP